MSLKKTTKAAANAVGLDQADRRSVQSMQDALTKSRGAKPDLLPAAMTDSFERQFAEFLGRAPDIVRFAAPSTAEQGDSGSTFRVDCVTPSGPIGFFPDWVAVQRDLDGELTNWVIKTKGRVWEGTKEEDTAMHDWCERVGQETSNRWRYIRVNQAEFRSDFATFRAMVFRLVTNEMKRKRDARGVTATIEEILQWRDEGRKWL